MHYRTWYENKNNQTHWKRSKVDEPVEKPVALMDLKKLNHQIITHERDWNNCSHHTAIHRGIGRKITRERNLEWPRPGCRRSIVKTTIYERNEDRSTFRIWKTIPLCLPNDRPISTNDRETYCFELDFNLTALQARDVAVITEQL